MCIANTIWVGPLPCRGPSSSRMDAEPLIPRGLKHGLRSSWPHQVQAAQTGAWGFLASPAVPPLASSLPPAGEDFLHSGSSLQPRPYSPLLRPYRAKPALGLEARAPWAQAGSRSLGCKAHVVVLDINQDFFPK